jgi:hypothetical protein
VKFKIGLEEMRHICRRFKRFGCRLVAVVAQPGMGTASCVAAVVHQYGHFRRPDGFRFYQQLPAGAWMLAAPTIYAEHGHRTAPLQIARFLKAVLRKKLSDIVNFLKSLEFWRNIMYQMMQLKMHGF